MEKGFSQSRAAASFPAHDRSRPSQSLAAPRASPWPSPAQRRTWAASALACPLTRRAAPDRGRARLPRGGHAPSTPPRVSASLRPRPRARLLLLEPVRSLTPARAAFPLLQSKKPKLRPSPRPQLRRRRAPAPPCHSSIAHAHSSASPSFKQRSCLCRFLGPG